MPEITLACVIGLAQIFFKQFEPVTYLESTYERTPEYFRKYEDRGFISKSWDNATELARSDVVFEKYYQDTYLFRIHRYFQKHPATDQDKYLLLNTTLHNQTELRDYFFMPGYQVFGPNTLRGLQDFVLKGMMKYYDQNQQNNFVTVDAEGNQRRLPTFRNLLFQLFNNLRNQTRYKECATHNSPEKLIDCERFFGAAESNKFRDAALLSKIQSVRYGIFVAGFEHFARIRQAVIDTDYKNEIAILELKKK
ncbi:MAG TPA: hypothetical protein VJK30_03090 [Coxiellaceae bacterium]|nr:hypothetical protein [Coxiellaceae bacterium]